MSNFLTKVRLTLEDAGLRRRILFVVVVLALTRFGAAIPMPGVDKFQLERAFSGDQFLGFLNIFSGGGLSNLSIFMLGVGPFITASIIMQLMTLIFPALKQMYHEDGEAGRRKVAQYSRLMAVPLAAFQAIGLMVLLNGKGVLLPMTAIDKLISLIVVIAGSILLMWLGELISEYGIGNGVSMIIFAGIVSQVPTVATQLYSTFEVTQIPLYLSVGAVALVALAAVVFITESERPIPVTYAKRVRGMKVYGGTSTYLPIRVNNAGVMPIIFAMSILLFPQMIANFLASTTQPILQTIAGFMTGFLNQTWLYGSFYFVLVVALMPIILQSATNMSSLAVGGTSLLIVVSVALDFIKQIDAQISMREY